MNPELTQPSLLSRVRDPANHAAWQEFDQRYKELILRYCRARGLQSADADDVRQLVMMSLANSLRKFEYNPARGRFRSYLGRIVRNAVIQYRSRQDPAAGLNSTLLAVRPAEGDEEPDEVWEREWVNHHYRLAMQTIRRTFEARSIEMFDRLMGGKPVEEVAAEFETTPQAVHKVKQRIRDRMMELINQQIREEDEPEGAGKSGPK